jgi:DNA-binding MarR family transcriptional regulator
LTTGPFQKTEVYLLHKLVIQLDQYARERVLVQHGITYAEFLVLMAAAEVEIPVHDNLCNYLDQSKSLVSQRITALRAKGLVRQVERPENRRQTLVFLTEEGGRILQETAGRLSEASEELLELLGPDREKFRAQLAGLVADMETKFQPEPEGG